MNVRKAHNIWIEQCEAAQTIKARFGLTAAFDYVVGEKLMNYASAASRHPDFARELPRFVSEVRRIFTPDEIGAHLAQIERAPNENDIDVLEEDDPLRESPAEAEERVRQFLLIKELLTATMLGTS
jgi:DNA-binding SARP family transcriptional activator